MVDFDSLMQPIDSDNPSGKDLRLDPADTIFPQLETMRQEIDPTIDPGGESKSADWPGVVQLAGDTLSSGCKDLELGAILTQGLVRVEGFPGLLTGLRLLRGLVTDFWPTVHPGWDEGEIVEPIRARPLSWVGSAKDFLLSIKAVPLSSPIGDTPYSWFDYEQSQRVDQAARQSDQGPYQELVASGFITGEQWRSSLGATPPERMELVTSALTECLDELRNLDRACEEQFEEDPPFFLDLRNLLEEIQEYLVSFQSSAGAAVAAVPAPEVAATGTAAPVLTTPTAASGVPAGPISSRDEAYRRLREAAEFLRKTEPHSPVPALVDRAVRWGNMNFENLFEDVVKNKDARTQTRDLLGLNTEGSSTKPKTSPPPTSAASQSPKRMNG